MSAVAEPNPNARHGVLVLLVVYLVTLAFSGFLPTPVDRPVAGFIGDVLAMLHGSAVTSGIDYADVEADANIVLVVPLGLLAAPLLPDRHWWLAAPVGLPVAAAFEAVQLLVLGLRLREHINEECHGNYRQNS